MSYVSIIFMVLFCLDILVHLYILYVEKQPNSPNFVMDDGLTKKSIEGVLLYLRKYGKEEHYGNKKHVEAINDSMPLGEENLNFINKYSSVITKDGFEIFNRSLMEKTYEDNADFVQIGQSLNDDIILLRRHLQEDIVYAVGVEDGDSLRPEKYASSIQNYIAMQLAIDSNSIG